MSSYATRLAQDLRNAYEGHDRDQFERALQRMIGAMEYAGPLPAAPRPRVNDCAMGVHCTCTRTIERETCLERTLVLEDAPRKLVAPIAGCTRKGGPCECITREQASACMYRGPAPLLARE